MHSVQVKFVSSDVAYDAGIAVLCSFNFSVYIALKYHCTETAK